VCSLAARAQTTVKFRARKDKRDWPRLEPCDIKKPSNKPSYMALQLIVPVDHTLQQKGQMFQYGLLKENCKVNYGVIGEKGRSSDEQGQWWEYIEYLAFVIQTRVLVGRKKNTFKRTWVP